MSEQLTLKDLSIKLKDYATRTAKSIITSPTMVWFVSLYLITLISMIIMNIFRVGFNIDGITGGPSYYSNLFLNYGLNGENEIPVYTSPYSSGILAWIFAPFIAIWMGVSIYFLKRGGFAPNGTTFADETGTFFYAFFNQNVYGFDINLFGNKGNLFYLGIIWLPVFAASIVTIAYKRRVKRETSIVVRFIIGWIIAIWIGIEMAKMTDPNLKFQYNELYNTLFVHRKKNTFVKYDGQYSPLNISTYMALMHIIVLIIFGLLDAFEAIVIKIKFETNRMRERRERLIRMRQEGITSLPWEEEIMIEDQEAKL